MLKKLIAVFLIVLLGCEGFNSTNEIPPIEVDEKLATPSVESFVASKGDHTDYIVVSWEALEGHSACAIYRAESKDGEYSIVGYVEISMAKPFFVDKSNTLKKEQEYYYKIQFYNDQSNKYCMLSEETIKGYTKRENPSITLLGDNPLTIDLSYNEIFADPFATAFDNGDGDITELIVPTGTDQDFSLIGTYSIYYSVTDSASLSHEESREVIVTASINGDSAEISQDIENPDILDTVTLSLDGIVSEPQGGVLQYTWAIDAGTPVSTTDINSYSGTFTEGEHSIVCTVSNDLDSKTFSHDFSVSPDRTILLFEDFNDSEDVSPFMWDFVTFNYSPLMWGYIYDSVDDYSFENEAIMGISHEQGRDNSKCAKIYDTTTVNTGMSPYQDVKETRGYLYYSPFTIERFKTYKIGAWIYRGENCTSSVGITIFGVGYNTTETIPETVGWHYVECTLNNMGTGDISIMLFKGAEDDYDMGEVRFDDISISYLTD